MNLHDRVSNKSHANCRVKCKDNPMVTAEPQAEYLAITLSLSLTHLRQLFNEKLASAS